LHNISPRLRLSGSRHCKPTVNPYNALFAKATKVSTEPSAPLPVSFAPAEAALCPELRLLSLQPDCSNVHVTVLSLARRSYGGYGRFRYQTLLPVVISYTATTNQSQHEACQNARETPLSPNRHELLSGRIRLRFSSHFKTQYPPLRIAAFNGARSYQPFCFLKSWL